MYKSVIIVSILSVITMISCGSESEVEMPMNAPTPSLSVNQVSVIESSLGSQLAFVIKADRTDFDEAITFDFSIEGLSAEPNVDFRAQNGQGSISVGSQETTVMVEVLDDDIKEVDEFVRITISNPINATINQGTARGVIMDDNDEVSSDEDGVLSADSYYGYDVRWQDEYSSGTLNLDDYNFELGDGCPDLCGWGNEELQDYTDAEENIRIENGRLILTAKRDGPGYTSARITTKDKVEFRFGRVDIRAKMPEGQGLWPALWMLGSNIDEVSWPACGEIDIMELIGSEPNEVLGTAHWGEPGQGSTFRTGKVTNNTPYSEGFHVYSIIWELNQISWYVDDVKYHTIRSTEIGNAQWRFNQEFFMIFNIAVGGLLPGNPDDTTEFPQTMEIDYVRVFQPTF